MECRDPFTAHGHDDPPKGSHNRLHAPPIQRWVATFCLFLGIIAIGKVTDRGYIQ